MRGGVLSMVTEALTGSPRSLPSLGTTVTSQTSPLLVAEAGTVSPAKALSTPSTVQV
jgi:hypothetical protein